MTFKNIVKWIWQIPQNVCGILWRILKKGSIVTETETRYSTLVDAKVYLMKDGGGVTLGKYIFVNQAYRDRNAVIKHECGHVKQSKILGPLYLIIIGIPSILHAAFNDFIGCCRINGKYYYEHFWTESWADKLIEGEDTYHT